MTQGERIRELRKFLNLTLEKFGEKIGMKKNSVSQLENGKNSVTEQVFKSICREFNVNEEWLRTGEGNMFNKLLEEDEMAKYMEDLLFDTGNNSVYNLIKSIMRTYNKLDAKSQGVIRNSIDMLFEDIKKEG